MTPLSLAGEAADEEQCGRLWAALPAGHTTEGPETDGQLHVRLSWVLVLSVPRQTPCRPHHWQRERGEWAWSLTPIIYILILQFWFLHCQVTNTHETVISIEPLTTHPEHRSSQKYIHTPNIYILVSAHRFFYIHAVFACKKSVYVDKDIQNGRYLWLPQSATPTMRTCRFTDKRATLPMILTV